MNSNRPQITLLNLEKCSAGMHFAPVDTACSVFSEGQIVEVPTVGRQFLRHVVAGVEKCVGGLLQQAVLPSGTASRGHCSSPIRQAGQACPGSQGEARQTLRIVVT
jgi:hypothetical protein